MTERIHEALDGEIPRESLERAETAELVEFEQAITGTLLGLTAGPVPDVAPAVMMRLPAGPGHAARRTGLVWRRALGWISSPHRVSFEIRPAFALAAAVLALVLATVPGGDPNPEAPKSASRRAVAEAPASSVLVHFRFDAPGARRVQLAGDFTDWRPEYALNESVPGVWSIVVPLEPGVHEYAFVVDGQRWLPDPLAPQVEDGFGGRNSRLDVLTPLPARSL